MYVCMYSGMYVLQCTRTLLQVFLTKVYTYILHTYVHTVQCTSIYLPVVSTVQCQNRPPWNKSNMTHEEKYFHDKKLRLILTFGLPYNLRSILEDHQ